MKKILIVFCGILFFGCGKIEKNPETKILPTEKKSEKTEKEKNKESKYEEEMLPKEIFENDDVEKIADFSKKFRISPEHMDVNFAISVLFNRAVKNNSFEIANFLIENFLGTSYESEYMGFDSEVSIEKQKKFLKFFKNKNQNEKKRRFFKDNFSNYFSSSEDKTEMIEFFLTEKIVSFENFWIELKQVKPARQKQILDHFLLPEKIKKLAKSGVNLDAKNSRGESLLFFAVTENNFSAVQNLIDAGAKIFPDKNGVTPIDIAHAKNFVGIINFFKNNFQKINVEKFWISFLAPKFFEQRWEDSTFVLEKKCDNKKFCPKIYLFELTTEQFKKFNPAFEEKIGEIYFVGEERENSASFLFQNQGRFFRFEFYNDVNAKIILESIKFLNKNVCDKISKKIVVPQNFLDELLEIKFCGEKKSFASDNVNVSFEKIVNNLDGTSSIFLSPNFLPDKKIFWIAGDSYEIENPNSQNFFDFKNLRAIHQSQNFGAVIEISDEKNSDFFQIWKNKKIKICSQKSLPSMFGPQFHHLQIIDENLFHNNFQWSLKDQKMLKKIEKNVFFLEDEKFIFEPILDKEKNFILDFFINGQKANFLQKPFSRNLESARKNCSNKWRDENIDNNFRLFFDRENKIGKLFLELRDVQKTSASQYFSPNPDCPPGGELQKIEINFDEYMWKKFEQKTEISDFFDLKNY